MGGSVPEQLGEDFRAIFCIFLFDIPLKTFQWNVFNGISNKNMQKIARKSSPSCSGTLPPIFYNPR